MLKVSKENIIIVNVERVRVQETDSLFEVVQSDVAELVEKRK